MRLLLIVYLASRNLKQKQRTPAKKLKSKGRHGSRTSLVFAKPTEIKSVRRSIRHIVESSRNRHKENRNEKHSASSPIVLFPSPHFTLPALSYRFWHSPC